MKKALIIIDMQNDYFVGGKMALVDIDEAMENTMKLIEDVKEQKYEIFFIQHISTREGATFLLPNSFRETTLQEKLQEKGIKDLIICGAMSHMCIDTTARAAFDLGYNVELISDACATRDLVFHGETIRAKDVHSTFMASLDGVFCEVKNTSHMVSS